MPVGWPEGDPEFPDGEPWDLGHRPNCLRRLAVTPKRGTALLWYNYLPPVDPKKWTDLGKLDVRAIHGGCTLEAGYALAHDVGRRAVRKPRAHAVGGGVG